MASPKAQIVSHQVELPRTRKPETSQEIGVVGTQQLLRRHRHRKPSEQSKVTSPKELLESRHKSPSKRKIPEGAFSPISKDNVHTELRSMQQSIDPHTGTPSAFDKFHKSFEMAKS